MSASAQQYGPDDPIRLAAEGVMLPDWPATFLQACRELDIDIVNTAQRMKLWSLWKDARVWE